MCRKGRAGAEHEVLAETKSAAAAAVDGPCGCRRRCRAAATAAGAGAAAAATAAVAAAAASPPRRCCCGCRCRCCRRQAAAALPLPLLRHATTIAVDGAPAAAAIAAASWRDIATAVVAAAAAVVCAAVCVTIAVCDDFGSDGSRAASGGCLGQRLHSLAACLPDVRVDGVSACAWAIAKETDAPTALGMNRRGARLASATSLSYRRAPRGQLMSRLRAVACAGMEQVWRQRLTACQIWR